MHAIKDAPLIQAAKAIHDEMQSRLTKSLEGAKSDLAVAIAKDMGRELDKRLEILETKVLSMLEEGMQKALSEIESKLLIKLGSTIDKSLEDKSKIYHEMKKHFDDVEKRFDSIVTKAVGNAIDSVELGILEKAQEANFAKIASVLKSLPPPQIVLPDGAIEVKMLPSVVNVSEKAFNLNLPKQPAPIVNFTPPPPRLVEKKHFYDEHGRPERTVDVEIKEQG